jgi:hypothetical protein
MMKRRAKTTPVLTRSPPGVNVRRDILEPLGIKLLKVEEVKWADSRQPNVVYGRARTIARLAKMDRDTTLRALRCIQASDASMLSADAVLAVWRYIHAHEREAPLAGLLERFKKVPLAEIRERAARMARGSDGKAHAAKTQGIYFLLADHMNKTGNGNR